MFRYAKENKLSNLLSREVINDKLIVLSVETNEIIRKIGDSGGGLYVISLYFVSYSYTFKFSYF